MSVTELSDELLGKTQIYWKIIIELLFLIDKLVPFFLGTAAFVMGHSEIGCVYFCILYYIINIFYVLFKELWGLLSKSQYQNYWPYLFTVSTEKVDF